MRNRWASRWLICVFALSGVAGLIYEVALQRALARAFGVSAWAAATVLASYMAGIALGAFAVGRLADRVRSPLRLYAALELAVALCAAATPAAAARLTELFARLAHGADPSLAWVGALRWALAFGATLVPTLLMGGTLPVLARATGANDTKVGDGVLALYTANLMGAAVGALLATYALLPGLGLSGTFVTGAAFNLAAVALVWFAAASRRTTPSPVAPAPVEVSERRLWARPLVLLAGMWSGLLVFGYEVVWTQLMAIIAGTSAYAFGLMLAVILVGLARGALAAAREPEQTLDWGRLGRIQLGASLWVVATLPIIDKIPKLFTLFDAFPSLAPYGQSFALREILRAASCAMVLLLPASRLGAFFPLLLRIAAREAKLGRAVGGLVASNTLGSVVGSLLAGFLLLPRLGSQGMLVLLVAVGGAVALLCLRGRPGWQLVCAATLVVAPTLPRWNLVLLGSGANVYFHAPEWERGELIFSRESVESGLTSVVRMGDRGTVLLSNGKFQGNTTGEITAQLRFAQVPLLFARGFERALLIGVGTGGSLSVLAAAPFGAVEAADLSHDIVDAARLHFGSVNGGALDDPRVRLRFADGRNLLLLSAARYDLITIELTSIWIAGAADLYNREFYRLARDRMTARGVLQQWVQLHHMTRRDLAVILNSIRAELPHVALFVGGGPGQVVASPAPLVVDGRGVAALSERLRGTAATRGLPGEDLMSLAAELVLDEEGIARLVAEEAAAAGVAPEALVSTDDNLLLEYSTPRSNAQDRLTPAALLASLASLGKPRLAVENIR